MKLSKKTALLGACLLSSLFVLANPEVKVNGVAVEASPAKITIDGDNVNVTFGDGSVATFDMDEVVVDFSSVTNVSDSRNVFFTANSAVGDELEVSGLAPGTTFYIWAAQGGIVYSGVAQTGDSKIDLSGWTAGMYLLKADGVVVKFIKK